MKEKLKEKKKSSDTFNFASRQMATLHFALVDGQLADHSGRVRFGERGEEKRGERRREEAREETNVRETDKLAKRRREEKETK